jgi:hypothetical protein
MDYPSTADCVNQILNISPASTRETVCGNKAVSTPIIFTGNISASIRRFSFQRVSFQKNAPHRGVGPSLSLPAMVRHLSLITRHFCFSTSLSCPSVGQAGLAHPFFFHF